MFNFLKRSLIEYNDAKAVNMKIKQKGGGVVIPSSYLSATNKLKQWNKIQLGECPNNVTGNNKFFKYIFDLH